MKRKPRLVILNPTCLDVIDDHREWLGSLEIEVVADQAWRSLTAADLAGVLDRADAAILPAGLRNQPDASGMATATGLKVLSIAASGYEWLDVEAATQCGIVVTYAPIREGAEVVADMAWGLMLATARQIPYHDNLVRAGNHQRGMGQCLWRKTLGIVGLGNIGKAVARRAQGFEMPILAVEPCPDKAFVKRGGIELVSLVELLGRSDFVSLHVRLNEHTTGMIAGPELALMKPSAYLINTARGQLVDEEALTEALINGRIAGAALDEAPCRKDSELLRLSNFVTTPHLGNRAIEGVNAVFRCAVDNVISVFRGEQPQHVVNPEVYEIAPRRRRFPPLKQET